ncbi:cupin domain-containing protein [Pedobacter punctiformis]|uniref:Cupin domain-containing protein n=1 Tax=Pedobacter punctiformis TaxID=3004097 RepID=A0ABT4LCW8_9SPHI|nr:cupin domain-containing protein [Pedobacter sp. HCMS5-2]MCZ4245767.1 cupin domain-containing protein [Pedobacter sp. HCMS5-2]
MAKQIKENSDGNLCLRLIGIVCLLLVSINSIAQDKIVRKALLTADIGNRVIKKVDVKEIKFKPGQQSGFHKHPCPVVSYIVSGTVLFQIEGGVSKTLKAGDVAFEPAGKPVIHFDNASKTKPLIFIPYYLINDEKELIEMLPAK